MRIEQIYWTVGPHDIVVIAEASDDEPTTAFLLELGSAGNLRTTTLRAYSRRDVGDNRKDWAPELELARGSGT